MTGYAQRQLTHDLYEKVSQSGTTLKTINTRIASKLHQLQAITKQRLSLSNFDDRRFILEGGGAVLPHGHYLIQEVHVSESIPDFPD